ncbi:MAG: HlyC/CorC family transporter [Phycicoccus sp.]|nr:HlyC/CorC family transporter [Phycicoccus sp.]
MGQLIAFVLIGVIIAFLAAAAEASIAQVTRNRAQQLVDEGRAGSAALVKVVADRAAYLSVLAFVRVAAETAAAVLVAVAVTRYVDGTAGSVLLAVAIMVVVSFVVVGVSPRTLGLQHAASFALAAAPATVWIRRLLGPVARLLVVLGNAVTPGKGFRDGPFESESELRDLVDLAGESEVIEAGERRMIHGVFDLGDTLVREVMVPRTDMITIDADRVCRQALNLSLRSGHSRIPVVGQSSDDILGLLYLKDVVRRVNADGDGALVPVTEVMRPMSFVPESKPVDALLREMQRDQIHFALVIDEYGGTAGLVTIEDILEEIVGEIADEYDREDPEVEPLEDGRVRVDATMHIDDFAEYFDIDLDEDEVDTVGGLIGKLNGRVPIVGSTADLPGLRLTAERMEGRRHRIATVIVERVAQHAPADAEQTQEAAG